jgi:hypothetical protein
MTLQPLKQNYITCVETGLSAIRVKTVNAIVTSVQRFQSKYLVVEGITGQMIILGNSG